MPIRRALPLVHCPGHRRGSRAGRDVCPRLLPLGEPWGRSPKSISCLGCLMTTGEGEGRRGVLLGAQTHARRGCGGKQGERELGAVLSSPLDSPSKRARGPPWLRIPAPSFLPGTARGHPGCWLSLFVHICEMRITDTTRLTGVCKAEGSHGLRSAGQLHYHGGGGAGGCPVRTHGGAEGGPEVQKGWLSSPSLGEHPTQGSGVRHGWARAWPLGPSLAFRDGDTEARRCLSHCPVQAHHSHAGGRQPENTVTPLSLLTPPPGGP